MAALQSHSSFRGQSGTDGGGEPREDLGWGELNRSHGERSVGREQAHAHESKGGEPRERPMPGVHATRRGTRLTLRYLAFPCPSLARVVSPPLPLSRTLLFFSPPPPSLLPSSSSSSSFFRVFHNFRVSSANVPLLLLRFDDWKFEIYDRI